jgi:uncharacterized protein (TIGR02246 family)
MPIDPQRVARFAQDYARAWNSKSPAVVAGCYAEDGQIVINRGEPWKGRAGIEQMAAGFYADVPDITVLCDEIRCAGTHAILVWTFTGHHAKSGRPLHVRGWEEWDLADDLKIKASLGWFDADDYARQVEGR